MATSEFSLGDFLKCFIEYSVKVKGVKSFAQPYARPWHEFLWNTRCVFLQASLPYSLFGSFEFGGVFPKSSELYKAMPELEWVCYARFDYRLMLYPGGIRTSSLSFVGDSTLERSLEIAYGVAVNVPDLLEF